MKEADLYPAVKEWLLAQGCTKVVPEVPINFRSIDVIGVSPAMVYGVEMKRCLSWKVIYQARNIQVAVDFAYAAVGSKPRKDRLANASERGIGVLRVHDGKVEVLLEPRPPVVPSAHYRAQVLQKAAHMSGEGVGGVPCLDGVGPARDCKRRVAAYMDGHPNAKWQEIYENVPNHYVNAHSMRGALVYSMARRDEWKKARKERAAAQRAAKVERQA